MPDESVWDKAARAIVKTQAMTRFTKTPMTIAKDEEDSQQSKVTGQYASAFDSKHRDLGTTVIHVHLHDTQPTYQDLQNVIHHEDIHALLDKAGITHPDIPESSDIRARAWESMGIGNRAGNYLLEAPAYVGAYNPAQMPSFTLQDRADWLNQFKTTLPTKVADMYQRIINSYQASQAPLPVQAPGFGQ